MPHAATLSLYAAGMAAILAGAWLTELTGSMVPLALGASAALMCTAGVVSRLLKARRNG